MPYQNVPDYTAPPPRQPRSPNLIGDTRQAYDQVKALTEFANTLDPNGGGGGTDADALPAPEVGGVRTVSVVFTLAVTPKLAHQHGFSGPALGPTDRNFLKGNWELLSYDGSNASYFAFADANSYAAIRKDYLAKYVADAIDAIPALVELSVVFPAAGAQTQDLRIDQQRVVGTVSLSSATGTLTNISYKKNGAVVALPVAVALADVLTVSATAPAGGGLIVLTVS